MGYKAPTAVPAHKISHSLSNDCGSCSSGDAKPAKEHEDGVQNNVDNVATHCKSKAAKEIDKLND